MTGAQEIGSPTSSLGRWVQGKHLLPEAVAGLRRRFEAQPERYLVVDDFLLPERLARIREAVNRDGVMETAFKVYDSNDWVSRERFDETPDDRRFIYETIYAGPRPGQEMSPAVIEDALFRMEMGKPDFRGWLSAVTGLPAERTGRINLKKLEQEHFLRWHNDRSPGRTLCLVLYLHAEWHPDLGGRLLMQRQDGCVDALEPLFNRLILFDPCADALHAVEVMQGDWARLNYSAWFHRRENGGG